ncbi:MAG TPA: histone deacetylase, partial [Erysipelothrix sp.]|nr:histone deacetylase [Erysipelothrix sp.]
MPKHKLGLSFFPAYDWAISKTHPEREERLLYTKDQLFEEGIDDLDYIQLIKAHILDEKDAQRVHFILPNLISESHLIAAGAAFEVYDQYMQNKIDKGFALVRPPGHHAHKVVYGDRGFCIINVGAVALEKLRAKYGPLKVAIVDTDAHHGDGTEDIYYNDKNTLVISIHQDGRTLYPGSGAIEDFGGPGAYGYNVNIPLPPETTTEGFLTVLNKVVRPILDDFKPDIIINSAGQDNHYSD